MDGFTVHHVGQGATQRHIEVLLHVAHCDGWQCGQLARESGCRLRQCVERHNAVHHSPLKCLGRHDNPGGEIQLARARCANQMGQEIAATKIARQADLGECRRQLGVVCRDAQITGQGQRQAGAGGRPGNNRQRRFGKLVQHARDFHAHAQIVDALIEPHGLHAAGSRLGKTLHVAARTKGPSRAGEHHGTHLGIRGQTRQRFGQSFQHGARQGVARLRPVHGECGHTVFNRFEQVFCHGSVSLQSAHANAACWCALSPACL